MSMQISVPIFFQFFWVCTEEWNAGSYGASVFNLCVCNGRIVSHSGCTILHPDQQYTSFNSSTPSPNAVFVFFITAILMGVRRCLLWSLHFPNGRSFHILSHAYWPFAHHLGRNVYSSPLTNCLIVWLQYIIKCQKTGSKNNF